MNGDMKVVKGPISTDRFWVAAWWRGVRALNAECDLQTAYTIAKSFLEPEPGTGNPPAELSAPFSYQEIAGMKDGQERYWSAYWKSMVTGEAHAVVSIYRCHEFMSFKAEENPEKIEKGDEMNDAEIRMRCLEAAVRIVAARIPLQDDGLYCGEKRELLARAGSFYDWVTRASRAPNGLPDTPSAPETGPELPEHTGWAG